MVLVLGNYRCGGAVCAALFVLDFIGGVSVMNQEVNQELLKALIQLATYGGIQRVVSQEVLIDAFNTIAKAKNLSNQEIVNE